jgi:hypothetical protein
MKNPKTTLLGVSRDAISLTLRGGRLLLRGTGKLLALSHKALDHVQDGFTTKRAKEKKDA